MGTLVGLLPSIKNDLRQELETIRDCEFENYFRIVDGGNTVRNTEALAKFANITTQQAQNIVSKQWIFND